MKCPYCGGTEHWKWNNPEWMKWTPGGMRYWRCSECGREYVVWFGLFPIRTDSARSLVVAWHWFLAIAALGLFAWGIPALLRS